MKKTFLLLSIMTANIILAQVPFLYNDVFYMPVTETEAEVSRNAWGEPYESTAIVVDSLVVDTADGMKIYRVIGVGGNSLSDNSKLTSITLPASVQYISDNAFANDSNLTTVELSNSLKEIGENCFFSCVSLTSVNLPYGLKKIRAGAFQGCLNIEEFNIPASVDSIFNACFGGFMSQLKRIFFQASTPPGIMDVLTDIAPGDVIVYVPADGLDNYLSKYEFESYFPNILPFGNGKVNVMETELVDSLVFTVFAYPKVDEYIVTFRLNDAIIAQYTIDSEGTITRLLAPRRVEKNDTTASSTEMFIITLGGLQSNETYTYSIVGNNKQKENVFRTSGMFRISIDPNDSGLKQEQAAVLDIVYYTVTVNSNNGSMGSVSGGGKIEKGLTNTLTATPNDGYHFVKWNDDNTDNPRTITVSANAEYTATFAINTYTLTVTTADQEKGTATGGGTFEHGENAEITATPQEGYHFTKWSDDNTDNPRTITITQDSSFTAEFELIPATKYTITVTSEDEEKGTVTGGGTFDEGEKITITATPVKGYQFVQWSDGDKENPRDIVVSKDLALTAQFAKQIETGFDTSEASDSKGLVRKEIRNGQIIIIKSNGQKYNTLGIEIK